MTLAIVFTIGVLRAGTGLPAFWPVRTPPPEVRSSRRVEPDRDRMQFDRHLRRNGS
jgi:hypothetical protein